MREYEKHINRLKRNVQEQLVQFWSLCNKENVQEAGLDENDSSMEFLFTEILYSMHVYSRALKNLEITNHYLYDLEKFNKNIREIYDYFTKNEIEIFKTGFSGFNKKLSDFYKVYFSPGRYKKLLGTLAESIGDSELGDASDENEDIGADVIESLEIADKAQLIANMTSSFYPTLKENGYPMQPIEKNYEELLSITAEYKPIFNQCRESLRSFCHEMLISNEPGDEWLAAIWESDKQLAGNYLRKFILLKDQDDILSDHNSITDQSLNKFIDNPGILNYINESHLNIPKTDAYQPHYSASAIEYENGFE